MRTKKIILHKSNNLKTVNSSMEHILLYHYLITSDWEMT